MTAATDISVALRAGATLSAPKAGTFEALSGRLIRSAGARPDSFTIRVVDPTGGLARIKSFPHQMVAKGLLVDVQKNATGNTEFLPLFWKLTLTNPTDEKINEGGGDVDLLGIAGERLPKLIDFERLLLSPSSIKVVEENRAEGAQGEALPASGPRLPQTYDVNLTDIRALWAGRGELIGKRNFPKEGGKGFDTSSLNSAFEFHTLTDLLDECFRVLFGVQKRTLKRDGAGAAGADGDGAPGAPSTATVSVLPPGAAITEPNFFNLVIDDSNAGEFWGPGNVRGKLAEIVPEAIDYKEGTPALVALEKLLDDFGLIMTIDWNGGVLIDSGIQAGSHRQERNAGAEDPVEIERAFEVHAQPTRLVGIPRNVFIETFITRWEAVTFSDGTKELGPRGTIVPIRAALAAWGVSDNLEELAYIFALQVKDERGPDPSVLAKILEDEGIKEKDRIEILAQTLFRWFRPIITDDEKETLLADAEDIREQIEKTLDEELESFQEPDINRGAILPDSFIGDNGQAARLLLPHPEADPLNIILPSFKMDTANDNLGQNLIVWADFARLRGVGWDQGTKFIAQRATDTDLPFTVDPTDFQLAVLQNVALDLLKSEGIIPRDRLVTSNQEKAASWGAGYVQFDWMIGGFLSPEKFLEIGKLVQNVNDLPLGQPLEQAVRDFINGPMEIPLSKNIELDAAEDGFFTPVPTAPQPPILYWDLGLAANADAIVDGFDPDTGVLRFKYPLGIPQTSKTAVDLIKFGRQAYAAMFEFTGGTSLATEMFIRARILNAIIQAEEDAVGQFDKLTKESKNDLKNINEDRMDFPTNFADFTKKVPKFVPLYLVSGPEYLEPAGALSTDTISVPVIGADGSVVPQEVQSSQGNQVVQTTSPPDDTGTVSQIPATQSTPQAGQRPKMAEPRIFAKMRIRVPVSKYVSPRLGGGEKGPPEHIRLDTPIIVKIEASAITQTGVLSPPNRGGPEILGLKELRQEFADKANPKTQKAPVTKSGAREFAYVRDFIPSLVNLQTTFIFEDAGAKVTTVVTGSSSGSPKAPGPGLARKVPASAFNTLGHTVSVYK